MTVLFTYPDQWSLVVENKGNQFTRLFPNLNNRWEDFQFFINENTQLSYDFWVVIGFVNQRMKANIRKRTILLLSEEADIHQWNSEFMAQFDCVIGSQESVRHNHYIRDHYPGGWQIQKTYSELVDLPVPVKEKALSAIISNQAQTEGHRMRLEFTSKLKEYFGVELDWYGRGVQPLNNKWDGIFPYKFSLAIENQSTWGYWSEKIVDCILSYTIPFYWGCPNIGEYLPQGSYVPIDIYNFEDSKRVIEETINSDFYEKNIENLRHARSLLLNKYQLIPKLVSHMQEFKVESPTIKTIYPEYYFVNRMSLKGRIKNMLNDLRWHKLKA